MTSSTEQFDAIIIGAGHNGLVAAGYQARAGKRVLVLELRDRVACWPIILSQTTCARPLLDRV